MHPEWRYRDGAIDWEHEVVCFLHVPKTAGITFNLILERQFCERPETIGRFADHEFDCHLRAASAETLRTTRYLRTHWDESVRELLQPQRPLFVTMLRDPVQRLVSLYGFLKSLPPEANELSRLIRERQLSLEEFATHPAAAEECENRMARQIAGEIQGVCEWRPLEPGERLRKFHPAREPLRGEALGRAARRRLESFAFVGLAERFEEGLELLTDTFGWPRVGEYLSQNVRADQTGAGRAALAVGPKLRRKLLERNRVDAQLYGFAQRLFAQRLQRTRALRVRATGTARPFLLPMLVNRNAPGHAADDAGRRPVRVAYFVMRYPTLTQTFLDREMRAVAGHGITVEIHPCRDFRRRGRLHGPVAPNLAAFHSPGLATLLVAAAREAWRQRGRARAAWAALRAHWPRSAEGWFMTGWGTLFALGRAAHFRASGVEVFHGAWATAPATAAMVLSALCGRPFSFGAHAYDLFRHGGDPLLLAKLKAARFIHTTTEAAARHLGNMLPDRRTDVVLARRGLRRLPAPRLARNEVPATASSASSLRTPPSALRILSVGRLVEKKGHVFQLAAAAELAARGVDFRLRIVGDGPLRGSLERGVAAAGAALAGRVEFCGALEPAEVAAAYRQADVFWHTGIVDRQGDRDGLPNVVPEALAHGLAVISSAAGGAGEAIEDGRTGLIVRDVGDAGALADAVERLAGDAALRERLGRAGRAWVEENFLAEKNTRRLAEAFRSAAVKTGTDAGR